MTRPEALFRPELKRDAELLAQELLWAGARRRGLRIFHCPFHEDRSASGSIYEDADRPGEWRYTCHAGTACGFNGDVFAVRARRLGIAPEVAARQLAGEMLPPPPSPPTPGEKTFTSIEALAATYGEALEATYEYLNPETGQVDMVVFRYRRGEGKSFAQAHPVANGWAWGAPAKPWPLYHREYLDGHPAVVVVEGEKAADAIVEAGFPAVTSPCGAGKAEHCEWSPLAGKKRVYLWPDKDAAGKAHMDRVAAILERLSPAPEICRVDPDTLFLPDKGDAYDFLAGMTGTADEKRVAIAEVLHRSVAVGPAQEVRSLIEATISGQRDAIPWPWPMLSRLTQALIPGTVSILCGDPGTTKSFLLLEAAEFWDRIGVPIAVFELEEDRAFHLARALAQLSGESRLLNLEWTRQNPNVARDLVLRNSSRLDVFGRCIYEAPEQQVSQADVLEWIEARMEAGARIVAVDPITMAEPEDNTWRADSRFMASCKLLARRHKASIVLVTHPKQARLRVGTQYLAGGAAYERAAQTILWLARRSGSSEAAVVGKHGVREFAPANRIIHVLKVRNANGMADGSKLAYDFGATTLRLTERGILDE